MKEQIDFLKGLQAQMKYEDEHDYDSQAAPRFWTIMDYRKVPGHEDYDTGEYEYLHNDGDHARFSDVLELQEFLVEYYEDDIEGDKELLQVLINNGSDCDFDELWEYVTDNLNENGYFSSVFVKEEEYVRPDTMFLTKKEAKEHLRLNHYHYTSKAHTYAMTAWRAPEVEKLLKTVLTFDWDTIGKLREEKVCDCGEYSERY